MLLKGWENVTTLKKIIGLSIIKTPEMRTTTTDIYIIV